MIVFSQEIESYFETLISLTIDKDFNFKNNFSFTELAEIEKMLQEPILQKMYQEVLEKCPLSSVNQADLEFRMNEYSQFFPPIELLENSAIFGTNFRIPNIDCFIPEGNNFSNSEKIFCLTDLNDLKQLTEAYNTIILSDKSIYTHNKNKARTDKQLISEIELGYRISKEAKDLSKKFEIYNLIYFDIKNMVYSFLNNDSLYPPVLLPEVKKKITNYFDCFYYYDYTEMKWCCCKKKEQGMLSSYLQREETDSNIWVRASNFTNLFKQNETINNGYLKIAKKNPIEITAINVNEEDFEWLSTFFEECNSTPKFHNCFRQVLINSSTCLEDLFFIYVSSFWQERYPIKLIDSKIQDISKTYYYPESELIYKYIDKMGNFQDWGRSGLDVFDEFYYTLFAEIMDEKQYLSFIEMIKMRCSLKDLNPNKSLLPRIFTKEYMDSSKVIKKVKR